MKKLFKKREVTLFTKNLFFHLSPYKGLTIEFQYLGFPEKYSFGFIFHPKTLIIQYHDKIKIPYNFDKNSVIS